MTTRSPFNPPLGLRNGHVQSVLNSSALRRRRVSGRALSLRATQQEWIMDCGDGVRLKAHYSPQPAGRESLGLAVLFHGWEGSSDSNYMLGSGQRLHDAGFDVFRLNFRDHGATHHLNEGIFHSCRLEEVLGALKDMQERLGARDWCLAGYSLGGNFALRVGLNAPSRGLRIAQVVAVCPVIDPEHSLRAMEAVPWFYERYYIRKWERSIRAKQAVFPDYCDYAAWYATAGLRERTRFFATRQYEFGSLEAYLEGYSVAGERLAGLEVPSLALTAADDPVIPVQDFRELAPSRALEVHICPRGGHCGFLKNWKFESWSEDVIVDRFRAAVGRRAPARTGDDDA